MLIEKIALTLLCAIAIAFVWSFGDGIDKYAKIALTGTAAALVTIAWFIW